MDDSRIPTPSKELFSSNSAAINSFKAINKNLNRGGSRSSQKLIREGMDAIARAVLQQVQSHCQGGDLHGRVLSEVKILRVGLSYPAFWGHEERTLYEDIIRRVMPEFPDIFTTDTEVDFHVESLASAHNLFWNQRLHNKILRISDKPALLVFLDFGGYTLNGCMFTVVQGKKQVFSYYRVGDTFCTSGGTQLWEQAFGKFAIEYCEKTLKSKLPPRQRTRLFQDFHLQIKKFSSDKIKEMSLHVTDPQNARKSLTVYLSEEESKGCFWDGLKRPIELAKKKIAEAATLSNRVRVVVSGGSGKSSMVQAHVWEACKKAEIDDPFFFHEKAGDKDSWNISKGAAIATANTMTGLEFMERGAAFGIQVGYLKNYDGSAWKRKQSAIAKPTIFWQEEIKVTADATKSYPFTTWCSGQKWLKIVCDPFLQVSERKEDLTASLSYDILDLPPPKRGYWRFTHSIVYDGDAMILWLHRDYLGSNKDAPTAMESEAPFSCPMYFENSSNCFLLDTDVDDGGRGLRLSEEGTLTSCTVDSVKEQLIGLKESTRDHCPPRKRQIQVSETSPRTKRRQPGWKPTGHLPPFRPPSAASCDSSQGQNERILGAQISVVGNTHDSGSDSDYEPISHPGTPPTRSMKTRSGSLRERGEHTQSSVELGTEYSQTPSEYDSDDVHLAS
ncbi:hypothetical protein HER10_EVM0001823 [Colletotrichum scovillei]|nr:uncharacterized protein HER10_EVM0001823 [Colletotrichum scovillei]KAF4775909.1 hypothetical protein HER10_EVM0001823 [Colletotrichum scovillei]